MATAHPYDERWQDPATIDADLAAQVAKREQGTVELLHALFVIERTTGVIDRLLAELLGGALGPGGNELGRPGFLGRSGGALGDPGFEIGEGEAGHLSRASS